jgi:hypothetical protein
LHFAVCLVCLDQTIPVAAVQEKMGVPGLLSLLLLDVPMWAIQLQKQMLQLYKLVTCPPIQ